MQYHMLEAQLPHVVLCREHAVQVDAQLFLGPQGVPQRRCDLHTKLPGFDDSHYDAVQPCRTTRRHIPKSVFVFLCQTASLANVLEVAIHTRSRPAPMVQLLAETRHFCLL